MGELRRHRDYRFIVFCDDLSFDGQDTSYKSLKAALEGGIEGRPENVVLYATSNRRHLLPRDMMENERSTAINPSEAVQEKVSLSDRFGLWLGFHNCSQDEFLAMVEAYAAHFQLEGDPETRRAGAIEWATTRGSRSGRVAWQFIQDLAGRQGVRLDGDIPQPLSCPHSLRASMITGGAIHATGGDPRIAGTSPAMTVEGERKAATSARARARSIPRRCGRRAP
jgi:predicted AAA+ superfamily ATPase